MDIYKVRLNNGNDMYLGVPIDVNDILMGNRRSALISYFNSKFGHDIVSSIKYMYSIYDEQGKVS